MLNALDPYLKFTFVISLWYSTKSLSSVEVLVFEK